ncbi:hypothetical protein [Metamycoplasma equirhinis]|uniref:hypothetical protein n=1 Tax=Metamycoplasma equirhinis TaxID=92402 RepID=UPI0035935698
MIILQEYINKNNKITNNKDDNFISYKKHIDNLRLEFNNKINNFLRTKKITNIKSVNMLNAKEENNKNIDDFMYQEDWNLIDNKIYWFIKTFFDFHSKTRSVLSKLKKFLHTLNPAWDASAAISEYLSALSENGQTGFTIFDDAVLVGKTVFQILGLLKQEQEKLNYSKDFIIEIFENIYDVSKKKNIVPLRVCLETAQETLEKMDWNFKILITLAVAKRKVKIVLDYVMNKYLIARERFDNYLRSIYWGSSWY